jgi:hypothetical protein
VEFLLSRWKRGTGFERGRGRKKAVVGPGTQPSSATCPDAATPIGRRPVDVKLLLIFLRCDLCLKLL